jgi:hypothetical protein
VHLRAGYERDELVKIGRMSVIPIRMSGWKAELERAVVSARGNERTADRDVRVKADVAPSD